MNYNLDFDYCAVIIMIMFFVYYFSRRRFQSMRSKLFLYISVIVLASIVLDILSAYTILYKDAFTTFTIYMIAILYFLVTGAMSALFCVYSLVQSRTDSIIKNLIGKLALLMIPYSLYSVMVITTPFTGILFYLEDDNTYVQGPFMIINLVLVFMYLIFSFIRITFFSENISFRRRLPFYCFVVFMITACTLQWILKDYLLYGFAEALGTLVLYLSNHNYNDLVDLRSDLYNRRTAVEHLKDLRTAGSECALVGVAIFDSQFKSQNVKDVELAAFTDSFAGSFSRFLYHRFGIQNTFCIETNIYLVTVPKKDADITVRMILDRFMNLWKIKEKEFFLIPGIAVVNFPSEADQINQAFDLITEGVRNSSENRGRIMRVDDIIDEKERRINSLEKRQEQLEKQYMEKEEEMNRAVNADRSKSLFLAQMSHEIRTPMTAILGMTELLLRDAKDKKIIGYANAIMNSGRNLLGIINDILDFSKIESGKMSIVDDKYMISSVVYDLVTGILQRVHEKKLNLRLRFDPNLPMYLVGDEIRVKQILFNILTNACKYTQKGQIFFEIKGRKEGSTYILTSKITDTGIGIRKENLTRIFDRFERFDPDINKSIEGTGLGLAIVRQLIELMGGNVRVDSEYGVGTTFTITIPQEISDETPSVLIGGEQTRRIAFCFENVALEEDMSESCSALNIENTCIAGYEGLEMIVDDVTITDIFVNSAVLQKLSASNSRIMLDKRLSCIQDYAESIANYAGKTLKTPISALNLGAFFNDTSLEPTSNMIAGKDYCAPTAKILVVDDNAVNLKIFSSLCEPHDFMIDCVETGEDCVTRTESEKYDVVFLDHMMPGKDGIDTIREIHSNENNPNRETPFVAFTANAVSGMKEMFLSEGFADFLSKPIDPFRLEEMLLQYIPREKIVFGSVKKSQSEESEGQSDTEFLEKLTSVGIDTDVALEYAGDSISTMKGVLDIFVSDGREKLELMKQQLKDCDYAVFTTQIHAVKSVTKAIGLAELSQKALALEMAGKNGENSIIDENAHETLKEYAEIIDKINKILNSTGQKADTGSSGGRFVSETTFDEILIAVKALLDEFEETAAQHLVTDMLRDGSVSEDEKKLLTDIDKTLRLFDYEKVTKIITEALDTQ
ncbi:MAG: response regulator [Lachnospiraceae bacterium]|nr:response regulator [Lachnospiraceae bacterium]